MLRSFLNRTLTHSNTSSRVFPYFSSTTQLSKKLQGTSGEFRVDNWLDELGLGVYKENFENLGYNNPVALQNLDERDLDQLGVTLPGHRKTLKIVSKSIVPQREEIKQSHKAFRRLDQSYWERAKVPDHPYDSELPVVNPVGAKNLRLMLVRHGQSMANIDKGLHLSMADHAIPLSAEGANQAKQAGEKIRDHLAEIHSSTLPPPGWYCRVWTSPYVRARQTAQIMLESSNGWISDIRETVFLVEQQFGLFEGLDWYKNGLESFPYEIDYYNKCFSFGGRFWAKVPLGESRFDVCTRVHQAFGSIHRDAARHGINNCVIVSHGVTLRAFLMMWLHLTPEWFEEESNPPNCSIRILEDGTDKGYIWSGDRNSQIGTTAVPNLKDSSEVSLPQLRSSEIFSNCTETVQI